MPTEEAEWEILAADPVTASTTVTIIQAASVGTPGAYRTMTHPDTATFPIVTYNKNPDRTVNFDQVPLFVPSSETVRTLGTTQAFVTDNAVDDVIVTERWEGANGRASMTAAQFRRMYELIINRPAVEVPEIYLQWAPADRSASVFNVILLDLRVGGGTQQLDVREVGSLAAGVVDPLTTGLIDRTVEWDFLLVSEVV